MATQTNTAERAEKFVNDHKEKGFMWARIKTVILENVLVEFGAELKRVNVQDIKGGFGHCIDFKDGSLIQIKDGLDGAYVQTQDKRC